MKKNLKKMMISNYIIKSFYKIIIIIIILHINYIYYLKMYIVLDILDIKFPLHNRNNYILYIYILIILLYIDSYVKPLLNKIVQPYHAKNKIV